MLDDRCKSMLGFICKQCEEGSFRVIEMDDLISSIDKKYKPDSTTVKICMDYLSKGGYVSIKYKDAYNYCLMPLPPAWKLIENEKELQENKNSQAKKGFIFYFIWFLISFLGAFLGSIIGSLLLS